MGRQQPCESSVSDLDNNQEYLDYFVNSLFTNKEQPILLHWLGSDPRENCVCTGICKCL